MNTTKLIINHLEAIDKGVGLIESAKLLAEHFNLEFKNGKWSEIDKQFYNGILNNVTAFTGISYEEMQSKRRENEFVQARYITITEVLRLYKCSLSVAGGIFRMSHCTALYAQRQLTGNDNQMTNYYNEYLKYVNNGK